MSTADARPDWMDAFVPLGRLSGAGWTPLAGGVLLFDPPAVWLVTARALVAELGDDHVGAWLDSDAGGLLLDVSDSQRRSEIEWLHHPAGLSATMFPVDARMRVKAFAEAQCSRVRNLQPMQPAATIGGLYGPDVPTSARPIRAVHDGIVASVDRESGTIFSTATVLPRNVGGPLLIASPYGGPVTIAGIVLGTTMLTENDPRTLPVRMTRAVCIDAAFELIRGAQATEQRRRITAPKPPQPADTTGSASEKREP